MTANCKRTANRHSIPHSPNLGALATDGAGVALKLVAAVVAVLHLALMPVVIVRFRLLPATETAVIHYYLT